MGHQRWRCACLSAALALAWTLHPAQPAQAAQAGQAGQADMRAAARRQTEQTDQANRDAAVPDEASSAATGTRPARTGAGADANPRAAGNGAPSPGQAPAPYGPVLYVNGKPVADTGRRNPAEVHDEADTGANPAAAPAQPQQQQQQQQQQQKQQQQNAQRQAARRHPGWQPGANGMAPRPLHGDEQGRAAAGALVPPPGAAPRPVVPSSSVISGCQGSSCMDASGRTYNGIGSGIGSGVGSGNAGVDSSGRLCNRTGVTVQCF